MRTDTVLGRPRYEARHRDPERDRDHAPRITRNSWLGYQCETCGAYCSIVPVEPEKEEA